NVVDDVTRECLAAVPDTSISGRRVVRELTELIAKRGKPGMIVRDNVLSGSSGGFWPAGLYAPTSIGAVRSLSQMASTVNGIAPCHSKHRIQRRARAAVVLTILKTRYAPRWKARTLSTGSLDERPHGTCREGSFHLASDRSRNGRYSVPVLITA